MSGIDPSLHIASVALGVSDLPRSTEFYEQALGLASVSRENGTAVLGADGSTPALVLSQIENPTPLSPGASGLFHVAWLHPSRAALADTLKRVARAGWPLEGASDHGVSEAIYLSDPDGLGIEIYADRPRERWARTPAGSVRMVTLPLDLEDLLAQSPGEPTAAIAPGTGVGHVHLKVADVGRASSFYDGDVGFEEQARTAGGVVPRSRGLSPPHRPELLAERGRGAGAGHRPRAARGGVRAQRRAGVCRSSHAA